MKCVMNGQKTSACTSLNTVRSYEVGILHHDRRAVVAHPFSPEDAAHICEFSYLLFFIFHWRFIKKPQPVCSQTKKQSSLSTHAQHTYPHTHTACNMNKRTATYRKIKHKNMNGTTNENRKQRKRLEREKKREIISEWMNARGNA